MKKLLLMICAFSLALVLVACNAGGGRVPTEEPYEEPTQEPTETPTEEPTEEPTEAPKPDAFTLEFKLLDDGTYEVAGFATGNSYQVHVEIPSTYEGKPVTGIGEKAFLRENSGPVVWSVIIPEGVTYIADRAFDSCSQMQKATLPSTLKSIGSDAFFGCTLLAEINLPDSLESIGEYAFGGCKYLKSINIGPNIKNIPNSCFFNCTQLESVTLPEGLETIGQDAFYCCAFESIDLPSTVNDIGQSAFRDCHNLKSLTIPEGITVLRTKVVWCYNLTELILPDGLLTIEENAICSDKLKTLVIPDSVTSIRHQALITTGLESLTVPFAGKEANSTPELYQYPYHIAYIFGGDSYTNKMLPNTLKTVTVTGGGILAAQAFKNCTELEVVILGDGVTATSNQTFEAMSSVKKIVLPKSIETLYSLYTPNTTVFEGYFYEGTISEWNAIEKKDGYFYAKKILYYSETQPNESGTHWHYVDGVPTVWAD